MTTRHWYSISAAADTAESTEVLIYDRIGASFFFGGVSASEMVQELNAIDTPEIVVRINSPGGNVFEGIAILNALRAHKAKVTTIVEGLAASAASFIAMAGDEVVMRRNAELMIHDAWGECIGNAKDMADMANQLGRISDNIASIYADKAGGDIGQWRDAMTAETWYSDAEAVEAGLADRVDGAKPSDAKAKNAFDLSVFAYAGRHAAPRPTYPSAAEAEDHKKEEPMGTLKDDLTKRLGISADADEATIVAAIDEALNERTDGPTLDQAMDAVKAAGNVVVSQSVFDDYKAKVDNLDQIRAEQAKTANARIVEDALRDGKITAADKDTWNALVESNPEGAKAALDRMEKGHAVPVSESGHGVDTEDTSNEDESTYTALFGKEA
ncbi:MULTISPECIES: head maturation protease, ClpP-related [unclassified Rhodococcus (in: high G+C Gram-positive bacteria)]|uniref:head maturation protease, ClpP-related n=1 Tax=unclassified Rhodococcus (in: high G+C Gram-positive bacteria) TaxID=192944 RepID=UPI0006FC90DE|nr:MULTISPECIES: head maturation protease, ClpP-related [unclassified Rhodococcus (in: high G+C Gram-positive bacteria)]KQU30335.1 hypothetical protein ASG69_04575 [Rhodococcus sp. Leaf225]KQU44760.1 hypothetical protein ASH03_12565 [Rhodococcus sp. Leaf258]